MGSNYWIRNRDSNNDLDWKMEGRENDVERGVDRIKRKENKREEDEDWGDGENIKEGRKGGI